MLDTDEAKKAGVEDVRSVLTCRMARAQATLNAQASHLLRKNSELTLVEWRVIQLLVLYAEAPMSVLAADLQMDKGQLSRRVNSMIEKGLIAGAQDPTDQRKPILRFTANSLHAAKSLNPNMHDPQTT